MERRPEEALGPSAAVPFKWEEAPGKAKPEEEPTHPAVLQIKRDTIFYNLLLSKQESLGHSTRSLYRPEDPGSVPFKWEAEPGKPKTPARAEKLVPLSPPPALQSPSRPSSPVWTAHSPRWSSQNLMKKIFHKHHHTQNKVSLNLKTGVSKSQEFGATKSSGNSRLLIFSRAKSSNSRSEFSCATTFSSSSSSCCESPKKELCSQGVGSQSCNIHPFGHSCLRHEASNKNSISDEVSDQISNDNHDQKSADEGKRDLEFQDALSEFFNSAEMRFEQVNNGNEKVIHINACKISRAVPRGFLGCL
ncbi:hypothetical protein KI387_026313, partial [Taxus chinensis]